MDQFITNAHECLNILRTNTEMYAFYLARLKDAITEGNLTLTQIGTSEDELVGLEVEGCRAAAIMHLGYLREATSSFDYFLARIYEELNYSGLSLGDIGTSVDELEILRAASLTNAA